MALTSTAIDHGQIYRFLNVSDKTFLDLDKNVAENGTKLILFDGNTSNSQRFRAEVLSEGSPSFRLLSQCRRKGDPHRFVTELSEALGRLVVYSDFAEAEGALKGHGHGDGHLWELQVLKEGGAVLLVNKGSGKALASQGYKGQVRTLNKDPLDIHQQWKLQIAEHSDPGHTN